MYLFFVFSGRVVNNMIMIINCCIGREFDRCLAVTNAFFLFKRFGKNPDRHINQGTLDEPHLSLNKDQIIVVTAQLNLNMSWCLT